MGSRDCLACSDTRCCCVGTEATDATAAVGVGAAAFAEHRWRCFACSSGSSAVECSRCLLTRYAFAWLGPSFDDRQQAGLD